MSREHKIVLAIFCTFLIYGLQSYFSNGVFLVPFFLNKFLYLFFALLTLILVPIDLSGKNDSNQSVLDLTAENKTNRLIPSILLLLMSTSWLMSDSMSTSFLANYFNFLTIEIISENFAVISIGFAIFISGTIYFFLNYYKALKTLYIKFSVLPIAAVFMLSIFYESSPFALLGFFFTLLLFQLGKRFNWLEDKFSIDLFASWILLVTLMESVKYIGPSMA